MSDRRVSDSAASRDRRSSQHRRFIGHTGRVRPTRRCGCHALAKFRQIDTAPASPTPSTPRAPHTGTALCCYDPILWIDSTQPVIVEYWPVV